MHAQFKAQKAILIRAHNDRAWLAWHIVALKYVKEFPTLKSLLSDGENPKPTSRTWQEQAAEAEAWAMRSK